MFYSLCCSLFVSSFGLFPILLFSPFIPAFYANIPALYAKIPGYLVFYVQYRAWCASGGGGGGPMGGVEASLESYVFFNQAVILTCQPDSRFRIPFRIPFLKGTGEPRSADQA